MKKYTPIAIFLLLLPTITMAEEVIPLGATPPASVVRNCLQPSDWISSDNGGLTCKANNQLACNVSDLNTELTYQSKFVANKKCESADGKCISLKNTCALLAQGYFDYKH